MRRMLTLTVLLVALALAGCAGVSTSSTASTTRQSIGEQLAQADPTSQSDAGAINADFGRLKPKCQEAPATLAGEILNSEADLAKHNITATAQDVANQLVTVTKGLGASATPTNCGELLAAYLVLREQ